MKNKKRRSLHVIRAWFTKHKPLIKNLLIIGITLSIFTIGALLLWISTFTIPTLDSFDESKIHQSTKIYDRTGAILLYDVFQSQRRTVVPFDQISQNIKKATLAIEDNDFYNHGGIKFTSIMRALLSDIFTLHFNQGGSTITQQVVKNSLLTSEKKISRKIKELVLAIELEKVMTKDQILDLYLNEIPYGGSIYGVEEASQTFFNKKASDLSLAESAYLAAIPQAPSFYSPYGKNTDKLENRKNLVLSEMLKNKFISDTEYKAALKEKVALIPKGEGGIKAPHFVMYVKDQLEQKYGKNVLEEGGLKVITTLDYGLEQKAEELAAKYAIENKKKFNAENLALVAIDPKTGQVLTMVGSRDYFDKEIQGNFNVALAHRQPGSSFKPFAYATAFNKGYTPDTVLFDAQTEFSTSCSPDGKPLSPSANCYMPQNYDNTFRGPITMRNALAQSINIPAIKTLYLAGMGDVLQLAKDMGITSLTNVNQYGLTLVLGGGEVSLLDMTSAYSVFANSGVRNPYTAILEVKDKDGKVLEQYQSNPTQVLSEETASKISNILSDNDARTPVYGPRSLLYFPDKDVAVKTGTTNDYKDAWIIGYSPTIAVGAWAGNNDNSPMEKKIAGLIISPFWNAYMNEALKVMPDEKFKDPTPDDSLELPPVLRGKWQGGTSYFVDKISGGAATSLTPPEVIEERLTGGIHDILYWIDKDHPRDKKVNAPGDDPQFKYWEYGVQKWLEKQGITQNADVPVPQVNDSLHTPQSFPHIQIVNPISTNTYNQSDKITVIIGGTSTYPLSKVEYFINNTYIGNSTQTPFSFSFFPQDIDGIQTTNTLKAVAYDSVLNKGEATTNFSVNLDQ